MKGALMQLAFYGVEDENVISSNEITHFKALYKKHSLFSMESIELFFLNKPLFGSTSIVNIKKYGNLLSKLYLQVDLPFDTNLNSYWTNRVGFRLIKRMEF